MEKRKIKRYYFRKMLASYVLVVSILLTCIFSTFFYFTFRSKIKEIDQGAQKSMEQTSFSAELLYNEVLQVSANLLIDPSVERFLSNTSTTPAFEYDVYNRLRTLRSSHPFLHSIMLYQEKNNRLLSDVYGNTLRNEPAFLETLSSILHDKPKFARMELPALSPRTADSPNSVLAFFFYPARSDGQSKAIVLFVRESYLISLISGISLNPMNQVLLLDERGDILLSTKPELFSPPSDPEPLISAAIQADKPQFRFKKFSDGRTYGLAYQQTDVLGWSFLSISDYNNDLNTLQRLLILLSIVSFSLLVFGLISAIFITRRMYSPLQDLMDQAVFAASGSSNEEKPKSMNHNEYDLISFSLRMLAAHSSELENRVENSAPLLKEALLRKLLFHTYVKQDLEFVRQLELYGSTEYRVILCTPDRLWSIPDPHKALFLYAIQNMLTEVLQKFADTVDFITDSGCLLFLLSCRETDGEIPARIRHDTELSAALRTIQQIFWENFHTSFSISVSGIQPFKRIHLARQEVQQALIDRLLLGEGCLITESVHQELANANPDIKNSEVKKILSQIAAGQNSTGAIDSYFSALRKVTPPAAITELKNFLDAFRSTFETLCPELSAPNLLFTAPESFETLDNIREQLNIWIDRVRNARVQRTSRRNQETIQHVKDYIAQNFSDPALGAEQIAEHFGLSSDYLRRLFKEAEGCGISEYLNTVRLNEAKELLLTTNLTANVICERIGIYSSTYFSTLFKKRFGITPILYRQSALDQKEKN